MKLLSVAAITLPLVLTLTPLSATAADNAPQPVPQTESQAMSLSDLVKDADRFAGQTVTVTGRFGGMCADGADFYFKDKLDLIEVIPPPEGLPDGVVIGTPLKIQGVVLVRGEHEDNTVDHDEAGGAEESEIKLRASVIETDRL